MIKCALEKWHRALSRRPSDAKKLQFITRVVKRHKNLSGHFQLFHQMHFVCRMHSHRRKKSFFINLRTWCIKNIFPFRMKNEKVHKSGENSYSRCRDYWFDVDPQEQGSKKCIESDAVWSRLESLPVSKLNSISVWSFSSRHRLT
jgi:hypothetical protein